MFERAKDDPVWLEFGKADFTIEKAAGLQFTGATTCALTLSIMLTNEARLQLRLRTGEAQTHLSCASPGVPLDELRPEEGSSEPRYITGHELYDLEQILQSGGVTEVTKRLGKRLREALLDVMIKRFPCSYVRVLGAGDGGRLLLELTLRGPYTEQGVYVFTMNPDASKRHFKEAKKQAA